MQNTPHLLAGRNPIGTFNGIGPLGRTCQIHPVTGACVTASPFKETFANILSQIIGVMTAIAALWFIFTLFTGAISWISAGSDKQALDNAKKKITNGIIGLFIVIAAYALIGIIGYFLGIDILNVVDLLNKLQP